MIGGRATHRFPNGRPRLLIAFEVAMVACWFAWMAHFPRVPSTTLAWTLTAALGGGWLFAFVQIMNHYERTGQAIALPSVRTQTRYRRLPPSVVAVRISFFVVVAAMLVLGLMRDDIGRPGIIVCVFTLFALGILSVILEEHHVRTGVAQRSPVSDTQR